MKISFLDVHRHLCLSGYFGAHCLKKISCVVCGINCFGKSVLMSQSAACGNLSGLSSWEYLTITGSSSPPTDHFRRTNCLYTECNKTV